MGVENRTLDDLSIGELRLRLKLLTTVMDEAKAKGDVRGEALEPDRQLLLDAIARKVPPTIVRLKPASLTGEI